MNQLDCAKRLSKLIDIKTISSEFGRDDKAFNDFFEVTKELFPELFKTAEVYRPETGGFLLIYRGKNHDKPRLFMNHHDVVTVSDKWKTDPFKATLKENKLYGRGTIDTKSGLYCMLEAGNNLAKENFIPSQDIYFFSDDGEEISGKGAGAISSYFKEKGITFDYVLDEGGMILDNPVSFAKGKFANICVGEKPIFEIKFIAKSVGGHSSIPPKNSPLVRLSKFILAIENSKEFKSKINKPTLLMLKNFSKKSSGFIKFVLNHPMLFYPILKLILSKNDMTRSFIRTTVAFTYSKGGKSFNVIPTESIVVANVRVAHHQGVDNVMKIINKYCKKFDISYEIINPAYNCLLSDPICEQFDTISQAIKEVYDDVVPTPYVASSASDARYFSKVSEHVFGFIPFLISNEQIKTIHGDNEYLDISYLPKAIKFYEILMRK